MTEAELEAGVIELARLLGWRCAHFRAARTLHGWRTPVTADGAGFPDLLALKDGRILAAELKSTRGRVSSEQAGWLEAFERAGGSCHVWRPADWTSGAIEGVLRGSC